MRQIYRIKQLLTKSSPPLNSLNNLDKDVIVLLWQGYWLTKINYLK